MITPPNLQMHDRASDTDDARSCIVHGSKEGKMSEHHSGTVQLTGEAQPDPRTHEKAVQLTPEDVATVANILLGAGRELNAYSKDKGWTHHQTIDVLRQGPPLDNYYDAAYHGAQDLTIEEAAEHLTSHAES